MKQTSGAEIIKLRVAESTLYNRFEEVLRLETAFLSRDEIDKLATIVEEKKSLMYKINLLGAEGKKLRAAYPALTVSEQLQLKSIEDNIVIKLNILKEIEDSTERLVAIKMASLQQEMNGLDKKKQIEKHFKSFAGYKTASKATSSFETSI